MPLRNTSTRFGSVSIALHWLGASAIVLMLGSALPMYVYRADHARRLPYVYLHSSMGITLAVLILARVAWHFIERQPVKLSPNRPLNTLASGVHIALLVLIAAQVISGPIDVWSGGFALRIFDFTAIPSPFGTEKQSWHGTLGSIHVWCGFAIAILVGLHLAGVAKHFLLDDDDTVPRMMGLMDKET